jgi:hypothetical protein
VRVVCGSDWSLRGHMFQTHCMIGLKPVRENNGICIRYSVNLREVKQERTANFVYRSSNSIHNCLVFVDARS